MMLHIEIHTMEGGRQSWSAIYGDTNSERLYQWGNALLKGLEPKPELRVTKGFRGPVVGTWQDSGWELV